MGLAPGVLPGRVGLDEGRRWYETAWDTVPVEPGLDCAGILQAAADGRIDTLVLLGADPLTRLPRPRAGRARPRRRAHGHRLRHLPVRLGSRGRRRPPRGRLRRGGRHHHQPRGPRQRARPEGHAARHRPGRLDDRRRPGPPARRRPASGVLRRHLGGDRGAGAVTRRHHPRAAPLGRRRGRRGRPARGRPPALDRHRPRGHRSRRHRRRDRRRPDHRRGTGRAGRGRGRGHPRRGGRRRGGDGPARGRGGRARHQRGRGRGRRRRRRGDARAGQALGSIRAHQAGHAHLRGHRPPPPPNGRRSTPTRCGS